MFKQLLLCAAICLFHFGARSQPDYTRFATDYTPMESEGPIPPEFITPIKGRVKEAVKTLDGEKSTRRRIRKDKKDFLLESNNELDVYLKSGYVVFNDEVNNYINRIAARVLPNNDETRKVRFYIIKYDYSNAFTFNEGVIFINVGLIARCNNEAEIASVLGHEYAHYIKKHSINYHTETKKAQRGEGSYRKKSFDDKRSLMSRYSKDNETEADLYGYELLKQSLYNHYATVTSLQGLEFSNAVPVLCRFDKTILEKGTVRIPRSYLYENRKDTTIAKKSKEDLIWEEGNPEEASHPSVEERVGAVLKQFDPKDTVGKRFYQESIETFENMRMICRFEICRIYLQQNTLDKAFNLTACLLQQYPDNVYLNRIMTAVLYRLAKYANERKLKDYVVKIERAGAEIRASNYLLRKLEPEEMNLIALRYAWYADHEFPGNPDISEIAYEMLDMYTLKYRYDLNVFADASMFSDTLIDHIYEVRKEIEPEPEPYIRHGRRQTIIGKKSPYRFEETLCAYALADLKKNIEFKAAFEIAGEEAKALKENEEKELSENEAPGSVDESDENSKKQRIVRSEGKEKEDVEEEAHELKIEKLILVEPEFERSDERKVVIKNHLTNEDEASEIRNAIVKCATRAGFGIQLMSANMIAENETQRFNDYCVIKGFVLECFDQEDDPNIPTDYNKLKEIANRYDTRYAAVLINRSIIYTREWKEFILPVYLFALSPIIGAPWLGTKLFPHKEYVYILGVLDLQENRLVYGNMISFSRKGKPDLFASQFYYTLITLKGKKE